ncbi:MAG: bifunctional UDP-N-acetylmuramoyl-tripeptide:D-alanyl-D-alanine ligase/alanine racemase [Bacteroidales bacterium]|jgi:alanine racemase|nr:bifunctional UDP-N-acetylmuramoyl-tripeptide:D-alanyl-D-alanine ligase/alanine racemase [Bacteroidales bacterium]
MPLFVRDIASLVGGTAKGNADFEVKNLLFDSRRLNTADGTVFFAITTANNDGRKYISDLYAAGVRCFVLQQPFDIMDYDRATFIFVNDVVKALQAIAKAKRQSIKTPVVAAITGSNGKTTVKDWIVQLINGDKRLYFTPKSYNSQIGVPLSVWQMNEDDDICVFEAGISMPNEMEALEQIIQPSIGILTTLTDAHQANFPSMEMKLKEKLKLFSHCEKLILCRDNFDLEFVKKELPNVNFVLWSRNDVLSREIIALLPFNDKASQENAINAYLFAKITGINEQTLQQRLQKLQRLEQRLEVKAGINNSILIDDTYSCDLMSLEIALDFLNQQKNGLERIVILSDIEQSSLKPQEIVAKINSMLINKGITKLYATGKNFYDYSDLLTIDNELFLDTNDFIKRCNTASFSNKVILIKGSRAMAFENISRMLEEKTHETRLEINLSALVGNVRYYKSHLQKNVKLMAMVKASSYGCGGWEVASALQNSNNADYLAVAFADEGAELRNNGVFLPIMVMSPEINALEKIIKYRLEPEVYSLAFLKKIVAKTEQPLNIHLKLDTGMHRLGLEQQDLAEVISIIKSNPYIKVRSVFSHLFGADNPDLDTYTLEQITTFEQNSNLILASFDYKILKHIANSAAILRFPQAHYDMVRLGIGMYGIGVDKVTQQNLRYVHKLRTAITQIRTINEGESVSYNRNFIAQETTKVAVIPIGYADGLNRHLGNEKYRVLINNTFVPIIGNVCMDMCMLNVTNIDVKEGDEVIIFAEEYPVFAMSNALNTIPYEVFTSISNRVKRVFFQE